MEDPVTRMLNDGTTFWKLMLRAAEIQRQYRELGKKPERKVPNRLL